MPIDVEIDRDTLFRAADRNTGRLSHKVCLWDMEQKYRMYGKVLLKSAVSGRITRTTCPSLPRFYSMDRWMDGWMVSNARTYDEQWFLAITKSRNTFYSMEKLRYVQIVKE